MAGKAILRRMRDIQSGCPPKHTNTDAFVLANKATVGCKSIEFFLTEIRPGGEAEEDVHPISEHAYFILSGRGLAKVEGEEIKVEPGDCLYIPPGAKHGIKPIGTETLRFVVWMAPPRQS
jgi:mannose-6-phosphate isomerase-like protein (cupin superfamily)